MNPNSQHQLWSEWRFKIAGGRTPRVDIVRTNVTRWLRMGFGSVGEARVSLTLEGYLIEARFEGVPAHDPDYVASVKKNFRRFVEQGFGPMAVDDVEVRVIAGDVQDGKPPDQWVTMPTIIGAP